MIRAIRTGLVVLGAVFALASCGSRDETKPIRIGYIPIADCAQLFVAESQGFFRDEGVDVELERMNGGAVILPALMTDEIDVGFSNVVSLLLLAQQGVGIKAIVGGPVTNAANREAAILVRRDSGKNHLLDLGGSTVAVNTRKNIVELFVDETLRRAGVDVAQVRYVEIGFPVMEQALRSGSVDAIATIEPFFSKTVDGGGVIEVADYFLGAFDEVQISTYNIMADRKKPSIRQMAGVSRALERATAFIANPTNSEKVAEAIAIYTALEKNDISSIGLPTYRSEVSKESLFKVQELMLQRGWLHEPVNVQTLIE